MSSGEDAFGSTKVHGAVVIPLPFVRLKEVDLASERRWVEIHTHTSAIVCGRLKSAMMAGIMTNIVGLAIKRPAKSIVTHMRCDGINTGQQSTELSVRGAARRGSPRSD
ncbi:hypothetical protein PSTG_05723 [Puccinia striiformis f. sp. tritici PST-78]|uniref:Uncharacterized protein n=1 Tax=Puccinia striiformis f. sp. tritici PST-78 TaxID=1165861 RepID=A0A0L0VP91_9BASI|nr:hypothetical protein PSTG_05723 [Puccinia striiformis f. sp. tritici PST-78]